jgi:hypothetical protein
VSDASRFQIRSRPRSSATTVIGTIAKVSFDGMLQCFVADSVTGRADSLGDI